LIGDDQKASQCKKYLYFMQINFYTTGARSLNQA